MAESARAGNSVARVLESIRRRFPKGLQPPCRSALLVSPPVVDPAIFSEAHSKRRHLAAKGLGGAPWPGSSRARSAAAKNSTSPWINAAGEAGFAMAQPGPGAKANCGQLGLASRRRAQPEAKCPFRATRRARRKGPVEIGRQWPARPKLRQLGGSRKKGAIGGTRLNPRHAPTRGAY
jgi:hypothetical protein